MSNTLLQFAAPTTADVSNVKVYKECIDEYRAGSFCFIDFHQLMLSKTKFGGLPMRDKEVSSVAAVITTLY